MALDNIFRKASVFDIDAVKNIEIETGLSNWSFADYISELSREDSIFVVVETNRIITGFILARLITNSLYLPSNQMKNPFDDYKASFEIEIYNIGVGEKFKRQGIGSFLLTNLIKIAFEQNAVKIWLEVRTSNIPAVKFYESFGFETIYNRKNYYVMPIEDAFVMSKKL